MVRRETLGGEDTAWLHMEAPDNPMVVNAVVQLGGRLSVDRARTVIARVAALPRFRSRLVEPRLHVGPPAIVLAPDFDVSQHIEHVELDDRSDTALRERLGAAVSSPLDPSRPLWKAYLIDRPGAGTAILFRVHHAIADGFALLHVLASVCDAGRQAEPPHGARSRRHRVRPPLLGAAGAIKHLLVSPADTKTSLKRAVGGEKRVAWSEPISLSDVKNIARVTSATVNDVLVAVVAGALGRYLRRDGDSTVGLELHAMVPVNLRAVSDTTLGNRFGLFVLGLPIGIDDPLDRVRAVRQRTHLLKTTPEAVVTYGILNGLGWAPQRVEDLAVRFFGQKTSLVLTNVVGPRSVTSFAGVPITRIVFWVPQASRMGLGISIFSYAGEVTVGVLSDARVIPHPDALVADLHAELAALEARVRAAERPEAPRPTT